MRPLIFRIILIYFLCLLLGMLMASCHASVVDIAQSEIGHGEIGGNNSGPYVRQYLDGRENLPWCAGFVSYCFHKAGYNLPYLLRAKSFLKYGKAVNTPQAGDLIVFSRKGGGHIGIIEKISKDTITAIEGNTGNFPSKVKRVVYQKGRIKNLLSYIRINKEK